MNKVWQKSKALPKRKEHNYLCQFETPGNNQHLWQYNLVHAINTKNKLLYKQRPKFLFLVSSQHPPLAHKMARWRLTLSSPAYHKANMEDNTLPHRLIHEHGMSC